MKKKLSVKISLLLAIPAFLLMSCEDTSLPYYKEQEQGKIVIRGYATDSVQIAANGKFLKIEKANTFKNKIQKDYDFVFYNHETENIAITDKIAQQQIGTYTFSAPTLSDTISFYYKPGIFINNVLSFKPGTLSQTGYTGYKFIFPNINAYSNGGYNGAIDGIIRKANGQTVGIAQNITKESFSTFVEFPYGAPPILKIELVKHGTTESYITGQQVIVTVIMQNNKSKMIVLEEKKGDNGTFSGVEGNIDLVEFFDF